MPSPSKTSEDDRPGVGLPSKLNDEAVIRRLQQLRPWQMGIDITPAINTGDLWVAESVHPPCSCQLELSRARESFTDLMDSLFPSGMAKKRFLDCGCNAGGRCFWAREKLCGAFGFDVLEHHIKQARFIKNNRTGHYPTDRIRFEIMNVCELAALNLDPYDVVYFGGLFNHLTNPIDSLTVAADLSRDVLLFCCDGLWNAEDGYLKSQSTLKSHTDTGETVLHWLPTGPKVCADLIRQLGFDDLRLLSWKQKCGAPLLGRIKIIASREENRLRQLRGIEI